MRKLFSVLSSTLQGGVRGVLLLLALFANMSAIYASDTQVDGIWYNFNSSTKTASVTYRGSHYSSYQDEYSGSVVIPETVTYNGTTYSVTSIGKTAFDGCTSLTSVNIPNSVTSIGQSAFSDCSSLTSVTIPNSVTSIGDYAFEECSSLTSVTINSDAIVSKGYSYSSNISHIFGSQVTEYIIGESVTSIGYYAFYGCSSLTSVTIPNSVTSIGKNAFSDCSSLTSVTIPNSVTSIGDYAFKDCSSLTSMTIPNSVTSIGWSAFSDCSSLTSVTIPNSVTSIGWSAFSGCTSLTSVNIPNSVTSIGNNAFFDCYSLTSVNIPNSVTSIGNNAFFGCYSLTSVTIGESVTSIGDYAFLWCSSLTSVTIPNSVTSIGDDAFLECSSLTSVTLTANSVEEFCQGRGNVLLYNAGAYGARFIQIDGKDVVEITIPNSITSIGDFAFYGCTSLTSVTIPNSVTSIGEGAFSYCFSLTSVTIPNSVTSIGDYAFSDCTSLPVENNLRYADTYLVEAVDRTLSTYSIKGGTKWVGNNAFEGCGKLTSITIPNSVTSIGVSAFSGCNSLTSVTIPNSVTSIGESAFSGCNSLTSVTIPNSVTSIGKSAFSNCSKLTSVTINSDAIVSKDYSYSSNISHIFGSQVTEYIIGDSVTSIGESAFEECSKLTSVTIGNSVTSIGEDAFYYCSKLTKTNYTGDIAGWCNIIFGDNYANPMYCSHNFYINDQEIKDLVIPNNVTSIGSYAFNGCSSLTSVTIPNSVTSIGASAFYNCSKLTKTNYTGDIAGWCNIKFGSGSANPMYCSHNFYINDQEIKDLVIPNSVTSIGGSAFYGCSSLTSVTIPNSVTNIGAHAFNSCSSLTSVTIPNSVTSIGSSVFRNCSSLTSVTIGNSVTNIGEEAFSGCSKLTSVTINSDAIVSKAYSDASNISHIFGSQVTEYIIGDDVKGIGNGTFYGCSNLTSITIGESVRSIGKSAFYECSKLASMTCEAITPPSFINSSYTFYGVSKSIPVYVPCGCVEAYNTEGAWGNFTNIQEPLMEYSVEVDANDTIMGTTKVDHNTFCQGTQISATPNIGYHFVQWSDGNTDAIRTLELTQDTILTAEFAQSFFGKCGNNLYWELIETTLHVTGSGEMYNYTSDTAPWKLLVSSIKSLTIAEDVTSIERSAFSGCTAIESIVWNAKNYANPANTEAAPFLDIRSQIKSFTFGDNVEHIPAYLCYGMDKLTSVTTPNKLNTISTSAFEGCIRLSKISLGTGLEEIAANAFAGCTRLYDIYTYATYPPFAEESSFANYNVYVYIPCEYQRDYILDVVWGKFKFIECIDSEEVTTDDVVVTPGTNDVTITWPAEDNADNYTIVIEKDGEVFCTLTFNAEGQLLNIAFAPGRDGNRPAQYAEQAVNGYRFTVTGLTEATQYAYNVTTKDAANQTIATYSGEFTTKGGTTTDMDNIQSPISNCQKILRNGQFIIVRDGVEYNAMGQEM